MHRDLLWCQSFGISVQILDQYPSFGFPASSYRHSSKPISPAKWNWSTKLSLPAPQGVPYHKLQASSGQPYTYFFSSFSWLIRLMPVRGVHEVSSIWLSDDFTMVSNSAVFCCFFFFCNNPSKVYSLSSSFTVVNFSNDFYPELGNGAHGVPPPPLCSCTLFFD